MGELALAVLVFGVILVSLGVKPVPQGLEYTVERFGALYIHHDAGA